MPTKKICGFGAAIVDHLTFVDQLKGAVGGMTTITHEELEQTLPLHEWKQVTGGSTTNTLKCLHELGNSVKLVGKIGRDPAGQFFRSHIGFPSDFISSDLPTGQCLAFVTPNGERTFRTYLGASGELKAEDIHENMFENVDLVHLEGYTLNADLVTEKVGSLCESLLSFDLASFDMVEQHKKRIIPFIKDHVDILFCNEHEAKALTGLEAKEASLELLNWVPYVVVTTSQKGGFVGHQNLAEPFPSFPVDPIDTTGAGDIFSGGFLHAFLQDKPLLECCELGAKLAAQVVQVIGTELPQKTWDKFR